MVQTDTVVSHPDVVFYDFYEAYDTPNATDAKNYLSMLCALESIPSTVLTLWL